MKSREIGEKLRAFRNEANLTQEELAEKAHIETKTLQNIESGRGNPTINTLDSLARALNVSLPRLGVQVAVLRSQEVERVVTVDVAARLLPALLEQQPRFQRLVLALVFGDTNYLSGHPDLAPAAPAVQRLLKLR